MLADPAAGGAQLDQLRQGLRMVGQQRQIHGTAGHAFQQIEHPLQRRRRLRGGGGRLQHTREQAIQALASAQAHGAIAEAVFERPQPVPGQRRVLETLFGQHAPRGFLSGLGPPQPRQIGPAIPRFPGGHAAEHFRELLGHGGGMSRQFPAKRTPIAKTHGERQPQLRPFVVG